MEKKTATNDRRHDEKKRRRPVIAATTNTTMEKTPLMEDDALFALLDSRKTPKGAVAAEDKILQAFENAGTGEKRATIHLYDSISYWSGNDARTFQRKLAEIKAETIELRINSPGGSVFEGVTIYNLLIAHPARVEVHIDGLAASIASVIALAGDEIHIAENAMMMIHDPSGGAWGYAEDLRKIADVLDRLKDAILNTYVTATGGDRNELARMMKEETWFTADEAVTHKFASRKFSPVKAAAFWKAEDFPELPENVRALFTAGKVTGKEEEDCGGTPQPRFAGGSESARPAMSQGSIAAGRSSHGEEDVGGTPTLLEGTVADVRAARDLVAEMKKIHGF